MSTMAEYSEDLLVTSGSHELASSAIRVNSSVRLELVSPILPMDISDAALLRAVHHVHLA